MATPVPGERARHLEILQRAENELDPVPFDTEAAWMYGRVSRQLLVRVAARDAG